MQAYAVAAFLLLLQKSIHRFDVHCCANEAKIGDKILYLHRIVRSNQLANFVCARKRLVIWRVNYHNKQQQRCTPSTPPSLHVLVTHVGTM